MQQSPASVTGKDGLSAEIISKEVIDNDRYPSRPLVSVVGSVELFTCLTTFNVYLVSFRIVLYQYIERVLAKILTTSKYTNYLAEHGIKIVDFIPYMFLLNKNNMITNVMCLYYIPCNVSAKWNRTLCYLKTTL